MGKKEEESKSYTSILYTLQYNCSLVRTVTLFNYLSLGDTYLVKQIKIELNLKQGKYNK